MIRFQITVFFEPLADVRGSAANQSAVNRLKQHLVTHDAHMISSQKSDIVVFFFECCSFSFDSLTWDSTA